MRLTGHEPTEDGIGPAESWAGLVQVKIAEELGLAEDLGDDTGAISFSPPLI